MTDELELTMGKNKKTNCLGNKYREFGLYANRVLTREIKQAKNKL